MTVYNIEKNLSVTLVTKH